MPHALLLVLSCPVLSWYFEDAEYDSTSFWALNFISPLLIHLFYSEQSHQWRPLLVFLLRLYQDLTDLIVLPGSDVGGCGCLLVHKL